MPTTPNTDAYMIFGYIAIITILSIYIVSLMWRFRTAHKDIQALSDD